MEAGLRTLLIDFFRRGEVARDIRMLAAQGALAPRAHEQLALLILLTEDSDSAVARAAEDTLGRIPVASLAAFLARSDVPDEFRAFFAARGVDPAVGPAASADDPLIDTGSDDLGAEAERVGVMQQIAQMTVSERVVYAMRGNREARAILVRDTSKLVAVAVLASPRLTDTEVEGFARMPTVSEEVLRIIGANRSWTRNYGIVAGLARNPKTPLAISMHLLGRLNDRDVKMLSIDRNVPEPLRIAARKRIVADR